MAKFLIILATLALVQVAFSLKCNKCKTDKCDTIEPESCQQAPSGQENVCLTEIYTDTHNMAITTKKCAYVDVGKEYQCVKRPNTIEVSCKSCKTDLCNSAPQLFSTITVFGLIATFLASRFV